MSFYNTHYDSIKYKNTDMYIFNITDNYNNITDLDRKTVGYILNINTTQINTTQDFVTIDFLNYGKYLNYFTEIYNKYNITPIYGRDFETEDDEGYTDVVIPYGFSNGVDIKETHYNAIIGFTFISPDFFDLIMMFDDIVYLIKRFIDNKLFHCKYCNENINTKNKKRHIKTKKHYDNMNKTHIDDELVKNRLYLVLYYIKKYKTDYNTVFYKYAHIPPFGIIPNLLMNEDLNL